VRESAASGTSFAISELAKGLSMFRRYGSLVFCLALATTSVGVQSREQGQNKEQERLEMCAIVMGEVLNIEENIPQDILDKAECVVVIPSMTNVALGIGGSYGRGAMLCRSGKAFKGSWGSPAMYAIEGGSFGLQLGAESTDVVLMVMNQRGVDALLTSKVTLGAGASAAAGPKGRQIGAATDATMRAEILSYSRSRGLFAGVSLRGTSLRPDDDATEQVYGRKISAREILTGTTVGVPPSGQALVDVLQKRAPYNQSGRMAVRQERAGASHDR
jgi:lipid-binding SYLF domain-containing protein